jgi:hypothetical protein
MDNEKDRLGEKLHDVEKAREDQWAHEQDQKLIEKMRSRLARQMAKAELLCPICHKPLVAKSDGGIAMMVCPDSDGAWLDATSLKAFAKSRQ